MHSLRPIPAFDRIDGLSLVSPLLLHQTELRATREQRKLKQSPGELRYCNHGGISREAARRVSRPIGTPAITELWLAARFTCPSRNPKIEANQIQLGNFARAVRFATTSQLKSILHADY